MAMMLLAALIAGYFVLMRQNRRIEQKLERLAKEVSAAAECVRSAGIRLDDQFSADVSELLKYNYLK
jgi:preprotein translocase subunit YajC